MGVSQFTFQKSTSYEDAVGRAAAESGIDHQYWDIFGHSHEASSAALSEILSALGFDTASIETIDQKRAQLFRLAHTAPLQPAIVAGAAERLAAFTVPANESVAATYEIVVEDGRHIAGMLDGAELRLIEEAQIDGNTWRTYQFPLPATLPLGYHRLLLRLNGEQTAAAASLILCPGHAYLSDKLSPTGKTAGFNVALYGLRSCRNWGCGDFTDLRALLEWAFHEVGFSFVGLNPLHALHNRAPYNTSPYLPLSIYYKNLIYLDIEKIPEFAASREALALFATPAIREQLKRLRASEFVEYQEIDALKKRFLRLLHAQFRKARPDSERTRAFEAYREREGELLEKFSLYCALDEILHNEDPNRWTWHDWPVAYQSSDSAESKSFAEQHAAIVQFYEYIQFAIDEQLAATQSHAREIGMPIGLYHDMAVATDRSGADLWAHRAYFVDGCRVGAPPDDFSPKGQDWGFPPPNFRKHRAGGYTYYRDGLRKILTSGGALRIDHVMRLFRLYWIPDGFEAADGTYVRDHALDLLHILAQESNRSSNIIVGEDLGTVTDEIRNLLAQFQILSYRLLYFEKNSDGSFKHSSLYPKLALVASTTHDLPTLAGFWLNRDIEARHAAALIDDEAYRRQLADRTREKQHMLDALHFENLLPSTYERDASKLPEWNGDLHNAVIGFMMNTPSMIVLINQEDFTKETEQQNLPGSTSQYPNWQRKMRYSIEDLASPELRSYSEMFRHQLARTGRR